MHQHVGTIRKTCFTQNCIDTMDFFLQNPNLYFTPYTVSLSMKKSPATIKDCMRLLKQNFYLSKLSPDGTVYHITLENMEFWHTDFKNHVISLQESKGVTEQ
jgi:hypothetical protein